jgi:hypothetical protein
MISIDVKHAGNLKPGDLYAGQVVPDAPTRPVQPIAAALRLTEVVPFTDDGGRKMMRLKAGVLDLTPLYITTGCLVILGVPGA